MASSMTFHESYGDVSVAQLRAYKRHNVSPSDHDDLVRFFGEDAHADITQYVKENAAEHGSFSVYYLWQDRGI